MAIINYKISTYGMNSKDDVGTNYLCRYRQSGRNKTVSLHMVSKRQTQKKPTCIYHHTHKQTYTTLLL